MTMPRIAASVSTASPYVYGYPLVTMEMTRVPLM